MSERVTEHDMFLESLPPAAGQRWSEWRQLVLGSREGCPEFADLFRLRHGLLDAEAEAAVRRHAADCPRCVPWVSGLERPADDPLAVSLQRFLEAARANPVAAGEAGFTPPAAPADEETSASAFPSLDEWSVLAHSGAFAASFRHVDSPGRLLEELGPVLPDLLADVGLDPDLAARFRAFAAAQAESEWRQATAWLPRILRRFCRLELGLTGLPCLLDSDDWKAVFVRCAQRYLRLKPPVSDEEEREAASSFYEALLQEGVDRWQDAAPDLEQIRHRATRAGVGVDRVRHYLAEGRRCERSIAVCSLSPARKR